HFKSKRCHGARGGNRDRGDGQGCYVAARVKAATQLATWARNLPEVPALAGTLITGDLNSYARETPLSELASAGFTDLVRHFHGLDRHSFRFRGRAGTLDYGLASPDLLHRVKDARLWAVNSDEPSALGYASARVPVAAASAFPWRSSDHDPVIVDLAL
ncbi:MAG: endonuclease, partial [Marinobacter sp.]|nr:endonuclease [Marinobacter sp.]